MSDARPPHMVLFSSAFVHDDEPIVINVRLIAAVRRVPTFVDDVGVAKEVTQVWIGGDKPLYVSENARDVCNLIAMHT